MTNQERSRRASSIYLSPTVYFPLDLLFDVECPMNVAYTPKLRKREKLRKHNVNTKARHPVIFVVQTNEHKSLGGMLLLRRSIIFPMKS